MDFNEKTGKFFYKKKEKKIKFEKVVPYINGRFNYRSKKTLDGKNDREELRFCLEIAGSDSTKFEWREQMQFHALVKEKKFDPKVKILDKENDKVKKLKRPKNLCAL